MTNVTRFGNTTGIANKNSNNHRCNTSNGIKNIGNNNSNTQDGTEPVINNYWKPTNFFTMLCIRCVGDVFGIIKSVDT